MTKGVIGHPKYKYEDKVHFDITINNKTETFHGEVSIVDAYGTFFDDSQPSYDIMCYKDGVRTLFKHIPESIVIPD